MSRFIATLFPASFSAKALNDSGLVVGGDERAQLYRLGKPTTLPGKTEKGLGHSEDSALGISSNGLVAGRIGWHFGEPFQIPGEATLWRNGRAITAPKLPGFSNAHFIGVNARGEAVGYAGTATMFEDQEASGVEGGLITQSTKALYWDGKKLRAEGWGSLLAINDAGAMVGSLQGEAVFRPRAAAPWQTLLTGAAVALSPQGRVCGSRRAGSSSRIQSQVTIGGETETTYFSHWLAFLWQQDRRTDLAPLPRCDDSRATGVNDRGMVVGYSESGGDLKIATLWQGEGHKPLALDSLVTLKGWRLTEALAINGRGQILCNAESPQQAERSVLLTPQQH